jgi:membrane-bound ClpP family serine protease
MKTIKKHLLLCLCIALIAVGAILLMLDYKTILTAWIGLAGSAICFGSGLYLGFMFDRKKMLPE